MSLSSGLKTGGARPPRLRLEALTKRFGSHLAVAGIDLELDEGELICLLGPSGCGKTTTLRMVGGLDQPSDGRILIGDRVVAAPGVFLPPERRSLGMVFQSYALWPHMTVRENLSYGMKLRGVSAREMTARVEELLRFVEMPGLADRYPSELSGGQQQRISVARALATNPEIVLFDEPLSNLDATLRETMRFELRRIHNRSGLSGIYVTHSQEEAFALGDRVAVMNAGRIEQIAPPVELYERPLTEFVARFVGLANLWPGEVERTERGQALVRLDDGTKVVARADGDVRGKVKVMLRPENLRIEETSAEQGKLNMMTATVEDVVFSGAITDCFLKAGDRNIRLQLLGGTRPSPGQTLSLAFAPESALVISSVVPTSRTD